MSISLERRCWHPSKMAPQIAQVAPKGRNRQVPTTFSCDPESNSETLNHKETLGALDLLFVYVNIEKPWVDWTYVFVFETMFALSNFGGTVIRKYKFVLFFKDCCKNLGETPSGSTLRNLMGHPLDHIFQPIVTKSCQQPRVFPTKNILWPS